MVVFENFLYAATNDGPRLMKIHRYRDHRFTEAIVQNKTHGMGSVQITHKVRQPRTGQSLRRYLPQNTELLISSVSSCFSEFLLRRQTMRPDMCVVCLGHCLLC